MTTPECGLAGPQGAVMHSHALMSNLLEGTAMGLVEMMGQLDPLPIMTANIGSTGKWIFFNNGNFCFQVPVPLQ